MKKLKELLSDTLVYGISSVVARFINYLLVPFYTDVFKPAQYGIVGLVYAGIMFLNVLFTFGMESAYLRYAKDREKASDIFQTLQLGLLGAATILALILWFLAPGVMPLLSLGPDTKSYYLLMIGILWFDTLSIIPFAELRLVERSYLFAALRTCNVLLNVALNFFLILSLHWGIEAIFVSNLVASGLTTAALWGITAPMLKGNWSSSIFYRALKFGLPFVPAGIGYAINESLDKLLLNNYLTHQAVVSIYGAEFTKEAIVGVYNGCYKLGVFMLLFVQMFRMAWQPFFLRNADEPDAKKLYRDVFRYFNMVAGVIFLGVGLFIQQIVQIKVPILDAYLIGREYWMGLHVVPLLLGAYWFQGWYMNFSAGIFIEEQTKVLPVITLVGAGITIVVNLLLIPYFGMMGSATATLLSYAVMAMFLYYKSVQVYPINYQLVRSFLMMAIAAGCLIVVPHFSKWIGSEWMSRFLMLIIGSAGIAALSVPNYFKSNTHPQSL